MSESSRVSRVGGRRDHWMVLSSIFLTLSVNLYCSFFTCSFFDCLLACSMGLLSFLLASCLLLVFFVFPSSQSVCFFIHPSVD